jgi:hypothetical protein
MKLNKINPSVYFLLVVIVVMAVFFVTSLSYPQLKVKLMPMMMSGFTIVMALIALVIDLKIGQKGTMPTDEEGDVVEDEEKIKTPLSAYLRAFAWMVWAILGVYFCGFIVALPVWVAVYMGKNGFAWWKGIVTGIGYIVIIYVVFTMGLQIELYPGVFGEQILKLF